MPQTFTQLHYHLVFSTKNRDPFITTDVQPRLWDYLGGIVRTLGGVSHRIGGITDHVHILMSMPQTLALADLLRTVKSNSSSWVHDQLGLWAFAWQVGYGAFTVSHSRIPNVREYIEKQEEHHRHQSFQDEFRALLRWHGLEPDEEHMWG